MDLFDIKLKQENVENITCLTWAKSKYTPFRLTIILPVFGSNLNLFSKSFLSFLFDTKLDIKSAYFHFENVPVKRAVIKYNIQTKVRCVTWFFNVDCIESERYALAKVGTSVDRKRRF